MHKQLIIVGFPTGGGTFQSYYELTILSQYSASDIAWIPSLVSFWMLATVRKTPFLLQQA